MYNSIDADVIIIGAGLAGLTAAFCLQLKEPTLEYIVLEGSDNIGGRAFSAPLLGSDGASLSYFDVGGQWISREQNRLLDLLQTLGIPILTRPKRGKIIIEYKKLYAVDTANDIFRFFGPYDMLQYTKFVDKVEMLCRRVKEEEDVSCIKKLSQVTLEEFINDNVGSKAVKDVIEYLIVFNCGVKSWQMSALFYIFFCISTKGIANQLPTEEINLNELRITGGVKNICDKLADGIGRRNIFTSELVTHVTSSFGNVEVKTKNTSYYCYNVIVALPPSEILKIRFSPTLPAKKRGGYANTSTKVVTNFVATYSREFWTERGFSGDIYVFDKTHTDGPIDFCANVTQAGKPALAGRIFDGNVTNYKYPLYKEDILEQLSLYFGAEALRPIDYCERTCSSGTSRMSCWNVGMNNYIEHVARSTGRLFWAGSETSSEWYGQLAGAVHSGNRAALEVLYDLRPQLLTVEDMMVLSPTRRSQRRRLKESPRRNVYYAAVHWKYYTSVGVIVLFILYRCKKKFFK